MKNPPILFFSEQTRPMGCNDPILPFFVWKIMRSNGAETEPKLLAFKTLSVAGQARKGDASFCASKLL